MFRCPACGKGRLFSGLLKVAKTCDVCDFSYTGHEEGDGPAYIAIVVIGTIAGVGASLLEIMYALNFWIQAAIWIPFIVLGSVFVLRASKAAIISAQYQLRKDDFKEH